MRESRKVARACGNQKPQGRKHLSPVLSLYHQAPSGGTRPSQLPTQRRRERAPCESWSSTSQCSAAAIHLLVQVGLPHVPRRQLRRSLAPGSHAAAMLPRVGQSATARQGLLQLRKLALSHPHGAAHVSPTVVLIFEAGPTGLGVRAIAVLVKCQKVLGLIDLCAGDTRGSI